MKKRAVIRMMEVTMGSRKRMYYKWVKINEKMKLTEEYIRINRTFDEINKVIKSVCDNIFVENQIAKLKE